MWDVGNPASYGCRSVMLLQEQVEIVKSSDSAEWWCLDLDDTTSIFLLFFPHSVSKSLISQYRGVDLLTSL